MSFVSGTLTNAAPYNATSQHLKQVMHDAIDAHPAWAFVEEWVSSANNYWQVYRCYAAVSGASQDFYLLWRFDTGSSVWWMAAEGWNSTTQRMIRPIVSLYDYTSGIVCEADGGVVPASIEWDLSYITPPGWSQGNYAYQPATSFSASAADYALSVTNSTISLTLRGLPPIYVGLFESRVLNAATVDSLPLYLSTSIFDSQQSSGYRHYTTRHPTRGGLNTEAPGMLLMPRVYPLGFANQFQVGGSIGGDPFQGGAVYGEPFGLFQYIGGGATAEQNGFFRGVLRHLLYVRASTSTVGWLDSLVVDGKTFVYLGQDCWVDQAGVE